MCKVLPQSGMHTKAWRRNKITTTGEQYGISYITRIGELIRALPAKYSTQYMTFRASSAWKSCTYGLYRFLSLSLRSFFSQFHHRCGDDIGKYQHQLNRYRSSKVLRPYIRSYSCCSLNWRSNQLYTLRYVNFFSRLRVYLRGIDRDYTCSCLPFIDRHSRPTIKTLRDN